MSLRKNIFASYFSQGYVTLIGILILPLYVKYMGAESYGLIGFFTMLQAWFSLLDIGLTPTIGRETARYHGGAMSALVFRQLFRSLSLIFLAIAISGGFLLWLLSGVIAARWLNVLTLPKNDVVIALQIMSISVALRWICGLYRGVVTGAERLVWLSAFNAGVASLRFLGVLPVMWYFGFTPYVFFLYQLLIALFELLGLWLKSMTILPRKESLAAPIGWSFKPVRPVLKFALTVAFTSAVSVAVTQTDKLVLSGVLSLAAYGHFTLAVLVAGGIMIISGPVSSAIMPRMTKLHAQGDQQEMLNVYSTATQLVSIVAGSCAVTLAFFSAPLLYAWTGDRTLAAEAAPILSLYALGNGFLVIAAFAYYLQYAMGNLRYHLAGNLVMLALLVPSVVIGATYYGPIGAGYVWLLLNVVLLLFWVAYVHGKMVPGFHWPWLMNGVVVIYAPAFIVAFTMSRFEFVSDNRVLNLIYVFGCGFFILASALLASKKCRLWLGRKLAWMSK
ncbi:oligosaccharide flippase family protein [Pseudomonas qingdaonensis]|uniref:oligosaccharide flippase family protein n=1 Tax=Pseudomonas qingdaonensis TaxID=2056231 RepID=UPI000E26CDD3